MKKLIAFVLLTCMALCTVSLAESDYVYEMKYLYGTHFDCLWIENEPTFGELVAFQSSSDFDLEAFINSAAGEQTAKNFYTYITFAKDEMNPSLVEYWARKGLDKVLYGGENPDDLTDKYFVYCPTNPVDGEVFPLLFVNHGGSEPAYQAETFGFCEIAARERIILVMAENTSADNLRAIYEQVKADYPIDETRVYATGSSAGAAASKNLAAAYPEMLAAIAPLDAAPGFGEGDEESRAKISEIEMPMIFIVGTADKYNNHQLGASTWNPNTVVQWNQLLSMQGHDDYQVTPEQSRALIDDSLNIVEHLAGLRAENSYVRHYDNTRIYMNSFTNDEGLDNLVFVLVENKGHLPCGFDAEIAWEFLSRFSRDTETSELIINA
ncbi:MAG: hypothetical protein Q4D04_09745 [Clostridia bacterium]|nr:hypothetical protein [Clostridia bacterium]